MMYGLKDKKKSFTYYDKVNLYIIAQRGLSVYWKNTRPPSKWVTWVVIKMYVYDPHIFFQSYRKQSQSPAVSIYTGVAMLMSDRLDLQALLSPVPALVACMY